MKYKRITNEEQGITLIALVVTIVVMLILAGISIGAITGKMGLLGKAKDASEVYEIGKQKDSETIGNYANAFGNLRENRIVQKHEVYARLYDNDGDEVGETLVFSNNPEFNYDKGTLKNDYGLVEQGSIKWSVYNSPITTVEIINKIQPTSTAYWFNYLTNLTEIKNIENLDNSKNESMAGMFSGCHGLKDFNFNQIDTSNVKNMSMTFSGCNYTSLDITSWNTEKVNNMNGMFNSCRYLTKLDLRNFDTSNVETMETMFLSCISINSIGNNTTDGIVFGSKWDMSKVRSTRYMFGACVNTTSIDMSNWNTASLEDMRGMFSRCTRLNSIDLSGLNTNKITQITGNQGRSCYIDFTNTQYTILEGLFSLCDSLTNINFGQFNMQNITTISRLFYGCKSLTNVDLSCFNTANVTDMSYLFYQCKNLTEVDISGFDFSKIETYYGLSYMFNNCKNLTTIYAASDLPTLSGYADGIFSNCSKLEGQNGTKYSTSSSPWSEIYGKIDRQGTPGYFTLKQ